MSDQNNHDPVSGERQTEFELSAAIIGVSEGDDDSLFDAKSLMGEACWKGLVRYAQQLRASHAALEADLRANKVSYRLEQTLRRERDEAETKNAAAVKDLENLRLMLAGEELADCEGVVELIIAKLAAKEVVAHATKSHI